MATQKVKITDVALQVADLVTQNRMSSLKQ